MPPRAAGLARPWGHGETAVKSLLAALLMSSVATAATAASRHDVSKMTCDEVQAILAQEGVATLRYPSGGILGLFLYDRYVRDQSFCTNGSVAQSAGVPTADKKYCRVRKCVVSDIFVYGD